MNHPSEWSKFFDENARRYRYKHKGSGVFRDTLMAIGKAFKGTAKNVEKTAAEKAAKTVAEKAGQKVGEIAVEKGSKQIQQILRKRKPKPHLVSQDAKKKLCKQFAKPSAEKTCFICRLVEVKSNFGKRNLIVEIFSLSITVCVEMFRSQPYLEKTAYVQVNLDTPLTYPGNNQTQNRSGHKFTVRDRDNFYDWFNAYFVASISSLRPWQMEQTLALTPNRLRSTVLSH